MVEAAIDLLVLVAPLLDVPSWQAVFDFSKRPRVLLENDYTRATLRQHISYFGTCSGRSHHRDHVPRSVFVDFSHDDQEVVDNAPHRPLRARTHTPFAIQDLSNRLRRAAAPGLMTKL
jgi:hypothetical protein